MSDTVIKSNSTATLGKVEGGLRVGANAKLLPSDGRTITITEGAYFEGPVIIGGGFECQSMRVEGRGYGPGGDVTVRGDLVVHGDADIVAHMDVEGRVTSGNLDVSGHLESRSMTSKRVRVGGHLKIHGSLEAEAVDVGGHFTVTEAVKLASLDVGGHARIAGGTITGEAKVMGHLESSMKLAYGELKVMGHIRLPAGSSGDRLSIHGNVNFEGETSCKEMRITGVAKVAGDCTTDTVEVFGRFDVAGSLRVSRGLRIFGTTTVKRQLTCEELALGGKLNAERALVGARAEITGNLQTESGLKAKSITVGKWSKVTGPLVGEEISIGEKIDLEMGPWSHLWSGKGLSIGQMARVDDGDGGRVRIESYSQAKRVFAGVIQMSEGSMAEQVTYTSDLKQLGKSHLTKPPVKTAKLPTPPL